LAIGWNGMGEEPATSSPDKQHASITVQDLSDFLVIVELAASRGAFRASEMTDFGRVFDKFKAFFDSVVNSTGSDDDSGDATD